MAQAQKIQFPIGRSCNYNNQVCLGGFKPVIEDFYCTATPHSLSHASSYLLWMARDEENGLYAYNRIIQSQSLPAPFLWYQPPKAPMIIHPETFNLFRGMCSNLLIKGKEDKDRNRIRIRSLPGFPGPKFNLEVTSDSFHHTEEGIIDMSGNKGFGVGLDIYFPGRPDILYRVRYYEAEGTIFGKKVKGAMRYIPIFGPSGESWETMRVFREVQIAWVTGFSFYDNGDKEMFNMAYGKGDWGWVFASKNEGEITALSRTVKGQVELDKNEDLVKASFKTPDCGDWEWVADCQLVNALSSAMPIKWALGQTRQVGDKRPSSFNVGWMEYFPSHV